MYTQRIHKYLWKNSSIGNEVNEEEQQEKQKSTEFHSNRQW